jgi:hypothetical protein
VSAIEEYIRLNNEKPQPFVWTKKVDGILEKVARCKAVTVTLHQNWADFWIMGMTLSSAGRR